MTGRSANALAKRAASVSINATTGGSVITELLQWLLPPLSHEDNGGAEARAPQWPTI